MVDYEKKTRADIANKIEDILIECNLDLTLCRNQGYDNAANIYSKYNGVKSKIKEKYPQALFSPCSAHFLNLCGVYAMEISPEVTVVEQVPKQKTNIRKNYLTMQNVKSKTNTNFVKNENIPNKCVSNMDEAILRWDKLMSKVKVSSNNQEVVTAESKINIHKNVLKADVNNRYTRAVNLSNTNDLEPLKVEMEKMNNYMEQFNDKLKTVMAELSNEKSSNLVLMKSVTAALDKYQNLELEQKTREEIYYKEKLDSCTKELESVIIEKNDLLKRLQESDVKLDNANKKILTLLEKTDNSEYAEKIKEIEDERLEWKSCQIHLENLIAENHKALNRKEQYIKNQDYVIENLTQEKLSLETRLNKPVLELQSNRSEEIEKYQKEIKQLSAIIADTERKLETNKESYNIEMSEMRDRLKNLEKLIVTKTDLINQQNLTLDLLREITPTTNDNLMVTHRWQ
ncbi:zinc finger MYM-type protein 1-like [Rhopalosiphum maidis]|uniref:zinc finger MYM-type protein 1-like n=1 Tax=Rhopalosiphum maidis TaxID=43146 RepID=UPI000EFF6D5C|nr:zinc finger MYM-type protein 1-like [Rhopalosiphum maidis]